jgi:hypothetical protein
VTNNISTYTSRLRRRASNQRSITGLYLNVKAEKTKALLSNTTIHLLRLEAHNRCELEIENNYVQQTIDKGTWRISDNTLTLHMLSSYSAEQEATRAVDYEMKFKIRSNKLHHLSSAESHEYYYKES